MSERSYLADQILSQIPIESLRLLAAGGPEAYVGLAGAAFLRESRAAVESVKQIRAAIAAGATLETITEIIEATKP